MQSVSIIIGFIVSYLNKYLHSNNFEVGFQLVTFFDANYPSRLKTYAFKVPIIYYRGDIKLLERCCCALHLSSPSYYTQKVVKQLRKEHRLIGFSLQCNSMTNISNLCDIIYCNDMNNINENSANLVFSANLELSIKHHLQLIAVLIDRLYILEGFPSALYFSFVANCIDNSVDVVALPTNIFTKGGSLPNILIDKGISPLLLYEK